MDMRRTETSIFGWTEDFPPRFDEDPDVSLDMTTFPLQVYKAAVLFDMIHRDSMSPGDHDEILAGALEGQERQESVDLLAGFIRLVCAALTTAGVDPRDPASEYRGLVATFGAVMDEESRFREGEA